jgi:hypothetical protein
MNMKSPATKAPDEWEVEDALRTLLRAKEIEKDTKLMEKVCKLAEEKMKDAASIASHKHD